jgi:LacI family transcriptional regulator
MLDRTFSGLTFPLVAVDNVFGVTLAVEHLLGLGHRSIGFVSWPVDGLHNRQERLDGYLQTMRAAGIEPNKNHLRFPRESWDAGVLETTALFGDANRPTSVVSANMELNLQVLAGLKQLHLRVPDDVSVVGFDDSPWDPLLDPPLTTVATPPHQLGKLAAHLLCESIDTGVRTQASDVRLEPHLVIRRSAAPPKH